MKRYFSLPALCGLLVAAGIAITVRHAAAAPTWDGQWSGYSQTGIASCTHPGQGSATGGATLNGNDHGQVLAWCANYNCGNNGSLQYIVRGFGSPANGAGAEFTLGTAGQSIGSTPGGTAHEYFQCQMGTQPYIEPPR